MKREEAETTDDISLEKRESVLSDESDSTTKDSYWNLKRESVSSESTTTDSHSAETDSTTTTKVSY